MIPELGHFALIVALCIAAVQAVLPLIGAQRGDATWMALARPAAQGQLVFVVIAFACLAWSFVANDFSVLNVASNSNSLLPLRYRFAATWGSHEGSLLLWVLMLNLWMTAVSVFSRRLPSEMVARILSVMAMISIGFLLFLLFTSNPFERLLPPAADGRDLNPLLQDPGMVIHPPMLYMGYVGFSVAFAFAIAALIGGQLDATWARWSRPWTTMAWAFLTVGIAMGSGWAYYVLGWGGWWFWDPVENASLMPWLTGTAFLHSVMMQEKRGMLKTWNMWLVFSTFWLAILGTFLTRSGIISSVHAFAQSAIGDWFAWFLMITLAVFTAFFFKNRSHLRSEHKLESLISRESSFLFNNLLFVLACFTVLWGTWFPKISEWVQGKKVTVGGQYYNKVTIPVGLLLLLLTAVGPLLAWRKTSLESLKRNFLWPALGALAVGIAMIALGVRPWKDISYFYALMAAMLAALVAFTVISEFIRGGRVISRHTGQNLLAAMVHLWHRNTRRYGGYIVHFGVALVFIGILGTPFNREDEKEMAFGDKLSIGPYTLLCRSYTQEENPNYSTDLAIIQVFKGGKQIDTLYPEGRFYTASQQQQHIPAIRSTLAEDLYVVYEGQNPDTGHPIIKVHLNPMVSWIWIGLLVMVFGTVVALVPNAAPSTVTVRENLTAAVQAKPAPVGAGD
jgi:cytochrome c-type biogenesis protein CcmF